MSTVRIKVLRPFRVRGDAFQPGAIVRLDPLDAHVVLGGKAELVDPRDREVIALAVEVANRAAMLQSGRQRTDDSFGPWQRR